MCMVVKDEERVLPRCLDSIGPLADEIVVVDTGSSDDTPNVAARYGAKVSGFDFTRADFSAARNLALNLATGRWILTLDADEVLHPSSIPLIRELTAGNDCAGYYFERLNHGLIPQKPTRDYVVRLFPNRPAHRYHGRVHETVDASILAGGGRLVPTAARIDHEFASTPERRRQRNHWYIGILKEEIAADPSDSSRLDFLAAEYHQLGMFAEAAEITERVTRARPLDPEVHVRAGLYHLLFQPDRQRARADFLEALRLRPGHARALSFLQLVDGPRGDSKPA
jgi:glycosyltransferase involved in cell wall biosynthesis